MSFFFLFTLLLETKLLFFTFADLIVKIAKWPFSYHFSLEETWSLLTSSVSSVSWGSWNFSAKARASELCCGPSSNPSKPCRGSPFWLVSFSSFMVSLACRYVIMVFLTFASVNTCSSYSLDLLLEPLLPYHCIFKFRFWLIQFPWLLLRKSPAMHPITIREKVISLSCNVQLHNK